MSEFSCSLLDYAWFALVLSVTTGTVTLTCGWIVSGAFKQALPRPLKWFWRGLFLQSFLTLALGSLWAWWTEAPLCFQEKLGNGLQHTSLTRGLALVWLVCVVFIFSWDLLRTLSLRRRLKIWPTARVNLLLPLLNRFDLPHLPVLLKPGGPSSPFVVGGYRPVLVLSKDLLDSLTEIQLNCVLAHELAHLVDRDPSWSLVEWVFSRLLFFHPLAWWTRTHYLDLQERAADLKAIEILKISPKVYAKSLLSLVEWMHVEHNGLLAASALSTFRRLQRRLEFLLQPRALVSGLRLRLSLASALLGTCFWSYCEARSQGIQYQRLSIGLCVQAEQELFLQRLVHLQSEPKSCEQEEK